jgi:hypothetical protein
MAVLFVVVVCLCCGAVTANADLPAGGPEVTYDSLPVGAPTTLPWWQRGRLHVGDVVISTRLNDISSRDGTTVVASDEDRRFGRPTVWFLVDGTELQQLPMLANAARPLISANGHWIAWLEVRARDTDRYRRIERYRVVVYNVRRQRIANHFRDRRLVEWEDGINGIWLRTLSNGGRLVFSRGSDGVQVLSPHSGPVPFGGPQIGNGVSPDGWPRGTTVFRSNTETSLYGSVDRNGRFDTAGRFTVSFSGLWSADGATYAYTDDDTPDLTYWTRTLDNVSTQLSAPTDVRGFGIVGWESTDAVILWHFDDYSSQPTSQLIRCFATTSACEQVPDGPKPTATATMPVN